MEHYFELPVNYNGEERSYKARLVTFGYTYKFYIVVDGEELVFEIDDEGQYRVLADEKKNRDCILKIDAGLIQSVISVLNELTDRQYPLKTD